MKNHPDNNRNTDKKLYSQLRNLRQIFDQANRAVWCESRALDRFLSAYWRENRCFGSRDRRLFSESLFAFFRFYGWLKTLLEPQEISCLEQGESFRLSGRTAAMLLAGAWCLENLPPEPAHRLLTKEFELPMIPPPEQIGCDEKQIWRQERFKAWAGQFRKGTAMLLNWELLQDDWSRELLQDMPDMQSYYAALAVRPPLWLRVQNADVEEVIKELTAAGLSIKRHPHLTNALAAVGSSVNLYTLPAYREGRLEVQDLASQVIAGVCAPGRGERWWDACAGAGGKTLALAELMKRSGKVVASDIRSYKLDDLKRRARRSGFPNIETRPWDGKKVTRRREQSFDGILVDAPCSCSGVWRRNPDGRWSSRTQDISQITEIQRTILENVVSALRPGGVLVYATCSVFEAENGAMIRDFLSRHPEFELLDFANPLTGEPTGGMLKIVGAGENCDSMFAARMRRKKSDGSGGK